VGELKTADEAGTTSTATFSDGAARAVPASTAASMSAGATIQVIPLASKEADSR